MTPGLHAAWYAALCAERDADEHGRDGIGPPPAPHNGWHGGPGDCERSNCPAPVRPHLCDGTNPACAGCAWLRNHPGACWSCGLGPVFPGGMCTYCAELAALKAAPPLPSRLRAARDCRRCEARGALAGPAAVVTWAGLVLVLLSATSGPAVLVWPGLYLLLTAWILGGVL